MNLGKLETTLDARPILGRALLLAAFGLVTGIMLAMSATPVLAQEGQRNQESQQALSGPEQATFTGVLQSEEDRFVFSKFFLVDEQNGGVYTLKAAPVSTPIYEGDIDLSGFVGKRVSVRVVPMNLDTPASSERFNSYPAVVTSLEVLGEADAGGEIGEATLAEAPCDAGTLTSSQYDECTATKEEITSGGGRGTPTVASTQGITVLPDTGGLELPILAGGLTLILGGLVLRKHMS